MVPRAAPGGEERKPLPVVPSARYWGWGERLRPSGCDLPFTLVQTTQMLKPARRYGRVSFAHGIKFADWRHTTTEMQTANILSSTEKLSGCPTTG